MEPDCYLQEHSFGAGTVSLGLHAQTEKTDKHMHTLLFCIYRSRCGLLSNCFALQFQFCPRGLTLFEVSLCNLSPASS